MDIQVAHTPSSPLSFIGPVYEFDFTPSVAGIYDFSLTSSPSIVAYIQTVDTLDATNFGSLLVRPVPEPAGLTLAGVCAIGLRSGGGGDA